jgi:site-specific DNA recombinase
MWEDPPMNAAASPVADLYLRLSDFRADDADSFPEREAALRARAADYGWAVHEPPIIENDVAEDGSRKPASAYKRQRVAGPDGRPLIRHGRPVYRVLRPGWQQVLEDLGSGAATAVLAEDLDRVARDPRDIEDLIDAIAACGGHARSLSGSLTLTSGGSSDQLAMARVMVTMAAKASADTARRVAAGRERLAGQSYQGGKRPYGYRHDPDAAKHRKTLTIDQAEAAVIRQAATDILDNGVSLKAITRDLRVRQQRGEPGTGTVMGAAWTPSTLRDVLLKPANAGLAIDPATRELIDAPWPPILDRDRWEQLRDTLTDPGRKTSPGNEPRWLVSKTARCPQCGSTVRVNGVRQGRAAYVCDNGGHLKRAAVRVDEYVERRMIWRLSQPDAATLLLPPPAPGAEDPASLDAELRALRKRRGEQMDLHSAGIITKADLARGMRDITDQTAALKAQLAAARRADPLKEFRDRPADVVWAGLATGRKRALVRLLADITFAPVTPGGPVFREDSVLITWKA